jgi:hypothetical protein
MNIISGIIIFTVISFSPGCGKSSDPNITTLKNYKQMPDMDVSSDPRYNFSSFAETVWDTKVKVAVADAKHYTGEHAINLLVPMHFDPTLPEFTPGVETHVLAVLPVGTRLRVGQLMKDNGIWGGVRVTATVDDEPSMQKTVYLDPMFFGENRYIGGGPNAVSITNWSVNPEMLERYLPAQPTSSTNVARIDTPKSAYEMGYSNGKKRGTFVAQHAHTGIDFSHLADPWQRNPEWRQRAVKIYGEDYVAQYELGYSKGFHEYNEEKR